MISLIKRIVLNKAIIVFICFTVYDSSSLSLSYNTNSTHTCNPTTHIHESFITHHANYDKHTECCTNKETGDLTFNEVYIYNDSNPSNAASPSQTTDLNSSSHAQDHLDAHCHDSAIDTRRQEIDENNIKCNETTKIENKHQSNNQKIIHESNLPKKIILIFNKEQNSRLDSTLILKKISKDHEIGNALTSPTIQKRFQRIKYNVKKTPHARGTKHIKKGKIKFINMLMSKRGARLIEQKQHPDLNIAQSAFNELKKLWHWKRQHTFLVPSLQPNSDESDFITDLGIDILHIAEKNLITRPDYITRHVDAQALKTIQEYKEHCYQLQQKGDLDGLFNEKERLSRLAVENGNKTDLTTNICLAIAENCWSDPLTGMLHSIIHDPSLKSACNRLKNLENQILTQAHNHNILLISEMKTWVINQYGFDILHSARDCYLSRSDYTYTPENQSILSDTFKPILDTIQHKDLPKAHTELISLEKQINKALDERNITDPIAQKECIQKYFGKDVVTVALKTYTDRSDHKKLIDCFTPIDVEKATVAILENNNTYESVANEMTCVARCVFKNATLASLGFISDIEPDIYDLIEKLKIADSVPEFIFDLTVVDHLLTDIQHVTQGIVNGKPTKWERSSELLVRGLTKFCCALNPIRQAENLIDTGHLIGKIISYTDDAIDHPIRTTQQIFSATKIVTKKTCRFLVNTASFVTDIAFDRYFLYPEEAQRRINEYMEYINILPTDQLAQLTAENYIDFAAQATADWIYLAGATKGYRFLKEIDALSKISKPIGTVARTFKEVIDTHLVDSPILTTAEGITTKMTNTLQKVGDATKEIMTESRVLIESITTSVIDTTFFTNLKAIGDNIWKSSGGLIYGHDRKFGNTLNHVLSHMTPNTIKKNHTVFSISKDKIVQLIDEAWAIKGNHVVADSCAYIIDMKKTIGTKGETAIRIIVIKPGTCEILTAYPVTI